MSKRDQRSGSVLGIFLQLCTLPSSFLAGFIVGLAAPLAAVAGLVGGIRLLTGQVPFLGHIWQDENTGERHLSFKLVAPDQVGELFARHKEQIGGDLRRMQAEIKAIIEQAQAAAQPPAQGR